MRREDSLSVREDSLRERERAIQLREERLELEKEELARVRSESDEVELRWSAREKNLLERLDTFNTEKEDLMEDWKAAKERVRELEREKAELTAKLLSAESSLMTKDGEILEIARELDSAKGREGDTVVELEDGVKTSLQRIMEDVERQQVALHDLEERSAQVDERERRLVEMEEILNKEREKVRELLAEQERGRTDLQEALEELSSRTERTDELEVTVKDREAQLVLREEELATREESVRQREREMDRLTTAELAEARAEDREEELAQLQRDLEGRAQDLEGREEDLEQKLHDLRQEEVELERQKAELLMARESMLKASVGEEDVPVPAILRTPPPSEVAPSHGRSGLAMRAALMVAQSRRGEGEEAPGETAEAEMAEVTEGAEESEGELKPLARLKCKACSTVIPIYTEERPLEIVCPDCGKKGILK
jgi:hypothetical protein